MYITREEAKMSHCSACSWYGICTDETMCEDVKAILAIPASDVKPVIHGEWIWNPDGIDWGIGAWSCSNCGSKAETWWAKDEKEVPLRCAGSHYCGNCGANMKIEKKYGDCY